MFELAIERPPHWPSLEIPPRPGDELNCSTQSGEVQHPGQGWGGVLPSNRLMGMCRWMGSHFHSWIDYNGVAFSLELLEWDDTFSAFGGTENSGW